MMKMQTREITAWSAALLQRESVKRSTVADIRERYLSYLQSADAGNDKGLSWLGSIGASLVVPAQLG